MIVGTQSHDVCHPICTIICKSDYVVRLQIPGAVGLDKARRTAELSTLAITVEYEDIYGRSMPTKVRDLKWFSRHFDDAHSIDQPLRHS